MPLSKEQESALAGLFTGDDAPLKDADPEDVAQGLKAKAPAVHTLVFNEGHQKASGKTGKDLAKAQARVTELEKEVTALEEKLAADPEKHPDVEKIRKDAKAEVDAAKAKVKELEKTHAEEVTKLREDDAFEKVIGYIGERTEEGQVRKPWLKAARSDAELRERIRYKDGEVLILQAGKEIPISALDDSKDGSLKALAKEYRESLRKEDPDAFQVHVDDGSGLQPGPTGGDNYDAAAEGKKMGLEQKGSVDRQKDLAFK